MNHQTRKLHAQTGLNMLKEAVLSVLSYISPDGKTLVSKSSDDTLYLWRTP